MTTSAIIVAAGRGLRMGAPRNKLFLPLSGRPVLAHTLAVFESAGCIDEVILVLHAEERGYCLREILEPSGFQKVRRLAAGGDERADSVANGLVQTADATEFVVVHDGARPLVSVGLLERTLTAARETGAAAAALPVTDTIKVADRAGWVRYTPERSALWAAQTPQAFAIEVLRRAYEHAQSDRTGQPAPDCAALVERSGGRVRLVEGERENIKITTPADLLLAEGILGQRGQGR